jgi:hypothetical protein
LQKAERQLQLLRKHQLLRKRLLLALRLLQFETHKQIRVLLCETIKQNRLIKPHLFLFYSIILRKTNLKTVSGSPGRRRLVRAFGKSRGGG